MADELTELYREIHDLTHRACETCLDPARRTPYRCCDPVACANAKRWMDLKGVTVSPTNHPTLPYMGEGGRCILDIRLRPLCTMHMCGDPYADPRYIPLRKRIGELEGADWEKYVA